MLAALGPFRFDITSLPATQIGRESGARIKGHEVLGAAPVLENLGPASSLVTINATLYPLEPFSPNGLSQLAALHTAAAEGRSEMMVLATGIVIGRMAIERVRETDTHFQPGGQPARIGITLSLRATSGTRPWGLGALLSLF
ncbi:MAG: phage tail protein [Pseudomonadota bacterium]